MRSGWLLLVGLLPGVAAQACDDESSSGTAGTPSALPTTTAGTGGLGGAAASGGVGGGVGGGGGGATVVPCTVGEAVCTGHASRRVCVSVPNGTTLVEENCPAGSGCVLGECQTGRCSDECTLGETHGAQTCELYDVGSSTWVTADPTGSLHDRARDYLSWLQRHHMSFGGVGERRWADPPSYTTVTEAHGLGDSAIWTGTYLASEALRLMSTGAADARDHIIETVRTLHLWFNVAGDPGLLSRFAKPSSENVPYSLGIDCGETDTVHCGVDHDGVTYDYIGHISRDQYQGVMLGYSLAYQALSEQDEQTRELIRSDVVELVEQLMLERNVPIHLTFDGTPIPEFDVTLRFVVLSSSEMEGGAIRAVLDTGTPEDSEQYGFQEFMPDLGDLVKQIPIIGFYVPIPRSSSAIMLASFFRVAMQVTDGVAAYADSRAAIVDYYLNHSGDGGNIDDWLDVAQQEFPENACGEKYYGHNITMEPLYNLARLEDDPGRKALIRDEVLGATRWPMYVNTKNCFFSFIYAGNTPTHDPAVVSSAVEQLAGFPVAPHVKRPVDLRDDPRYMPHEDGCTDQCNHDTAVDVAERVYGDFIWQRQPWGLYSAGDLSFTGPGVDYLTAYWLGRFHEFIDEDSAGRCAAWH